MANNVQAEAVVSAGVRFLSAEVTYAGDASTHAPGCFLGIVSGAEGSQTFTEYVGGAGAVTAGTQRVTLASDDPAVASLAVIDDWDESDRAKVNLIVGQAGIAAGAGAVGATVPRVTLASDDPGVALLTTIDADTGSILTAVQLIDDAIYTDATGTPSKGIAVMGTDGTNPQLVSVTSGGHVHIHDGGNTITVDGTVAATQSGTWTVQPGNTANTTAWLVTGTGGTFPVTDSGGSLTIDHTALDLLHTADFDSGAGTDTTPAIGIAVAASGGAAVITGDTTNGLDVDVTRVSGTVTVDGSGVTQPVSHAALTELAAAIDTEVQCDIVGALPAGDNNIGNFDLASAIPAGTNNIGDVDVLSVVPGTGATNLGKAEDAAHTTGDVGVMAMTVRQDTAAALSGTDADYQPLITDASGRLHVNVGNTVTVGSHAVTNAGVFAVQVDGSALTALQLIDDPVFADDAAFTLASSKVMMVGAIRDDSLSTLTAIEGDAVPLRVSSTGALHVTGGGGGTEYTEDAAAAADPVGTALILVRKDTPAATVSADGDNIAQRGSDYGAAYVTLVDNAGNFVAVGGGTQYDEDTATAAGEKLTMAGVVRQDTAGSLVGADQDRTVLSVDATGRLWCNVSNTVTVGSHAVTNAGTFAVQVDGSALTSLQLLDDVVYVDDADWTDDTSKHALVGGVYQSSPHTVTDGDVSPFLCDVNGRLATTAVQGAPAATTGTITANGQTVAATLSSRYPMVFFSINGTYGSVAIIFEVSDDGGTTWYAIDAVRVNDGAVEAQSGTLTDTSRLWQCHVGSLTNFRVRATAYTSGTANIRIVPGAFPVESAASIYDGGGSITVDGSVAASQSGTWNVTDISGTVSLPTGASTAANQSTIIGHLDGVEGLLTTIDGDTGNILTSVQLLDDTVFAEDVAAQAGDKGIAILAVRRDADTTLVGADNDYANLQVDANGYLKVEIFDGGGSHTVDNAGTFAVQVDAALPAGTNAIGKLAANSGVDIGDVDVTSIAAGTNNIGNVGLIPRTSGGMTIFRSIDIDETEEEVKATAGQLFCITAFNTTAAPLYLKFYNATAANVTVGTTTPVLTFLVPGNGDSDGAGFVLNNEIGWAFSTAITVACTTGVADNDTGAPGANACIINLGYA